MNTSATFSRREALKTLGAGAALLSSGALSSRSLAGEPAAVLSELVQPFTLPKLTYAYNALEPHIDARTMEIHHSKHHQSYIDNANKALAEVPELGKSTAENILRNLSSAPERVRVTLRNNVGGHHNHAFFWRVIGPAKAGNAPSGELADAITKSFGSLANCKTQFADAAMKRFGSGWAWLASKGGTLSILSTANQDSPLSEGSIPVLGLDVWEHAYYLKYQNLRADYVAAFWNVVNWNEVASNFAAARKV